MRTPAGTECTHYYEDFYRGREIQECRLAKANPQSMDWKPSDCAKCAIPEILAANASKYLELELTIKPRLMGLGRVIEIRATCLRHKIEITDPYIGCPECNAERPGLDIFRQALEQEDDSD